MQSYSAKVKSVLLVVKWYIRNGLFHPLAILAIIIGFSLYVEALKRTLYFEHPEAIHARVILEYVFLPLSAFISALVVTVKPRELLFELSIFKNWTQLFFGKLLSFLVFMIPVTILVAAVNAVMGHPEIFEPSTESIIARLVTYTAIVAVGLAMGSQKVVIVFLVSFTFIIPIASNILAAIIMNLSGELGPILSTILYSLSPINVEIYRDYMRIDFKLLNLITGMLSLLVIIASLYSFRNQEVRIMD